MYSDFISADINFSQRVFYSTISSPVALEAMRNSVTHNDILFIVRLEEIEGALKLVALVDKQEEPGVLMTPD